MFIVGGFYITQEILQAFSIASRLVSIKGKLGIYVYANKPQYRYSNIGLRLIAILRQIFIIQLLRSISTRLPGKFAIFLFQPIYYFEKFINFGIVGCHGTGSEKFNKNDYFRRVIDRFKTRYATEHTNEEVIEWFLNEKFNNIVLGENYPVSMTGTKEKNYENEKKVTINLIR